VAQVKKVIIKKGREKPIYRRHPWIFSGAVKKVDGDPSPGEPVQVTDSEGSFLAWGAYSPQSQIMIRIWSWNQEQMITPDFLTSRIQSSLDYRHRIGFDHPMMRLVHAESDGLPGLIVDKYGDILVYQLLSAGVEYWKEEIPEILADLTHAETIYERSDGDIRGKEGLPRRAGTVRGSEPEELITIEDAGVKTLIDIRKGHKTGYYLDQRENRIKVSTLCSGKKVLDCFCYTGGFSIPAAIKGASSITMVDESQDALNLAERNAAINNLQGDLIKVLKGDVFALLRKFRDRGEQFDLIILDPPKFAPTASFAEKAARGYKDINLLAFKLLSPGGLLATFSCSGGISREFFLRVLSGAALDAEVNARIQINMGQSADHSVNLSFPEGIYLKGFGIRVE
jgi:23S rRNA (cytosine1962-C5)-methyltransferase